MYRNQRGRANNANEAEERSQRDQRRSRSRSRNRDDQKEVLDLTVNRVRERDVVDDFDYVYSDFRWSELPDTSLNAEEKVFFFFFSFFFCFLVS